MYQLSLTASDGSLSASSEFFLSVRPAKPVNLAPVINLNNPLAITLPNDKNAFYASVVDPGVGGLGSSGIYYRWQLLSGPGIVELSNPSGTSRSSSIVTKAYFSAPGSYNIELYASDGELNTTKAIVQVVNPEPPVFVIPPPTPPNPGNGNPAEPLEFEGPIQSLGNTSIVVNGISVFYDDTTSIVFEDGTGNVLAVGLIAAVIGMQNTDGSVNASSISLAP